MDPAIAANNLGKRYDIYRRNVDRVKHVLTGRRYAEAFWALREVSFEVMPGEAVGVIGRNGSGKSTLMQIIAGTLTPTEGEARIRGRIAALLELGSGFNPSFTGRENIYLAGAIMGFSAREMDEKFDDIASFADIGEFLEQPVEVYSSGMYARLAFSVAISVRPDILIVDEILSVGDAGFQQKCVGRMKKMRDEGLTLLFVSHSAETVKSICTRGLFLQQGRQKYFGAAVEAVDLYAASLRAETTARAIQSVEVRRPGFSAAVSTEQDELAGNGGGNGTGHARISAVRLTNAAGEAVDVVNAMERVVIEADVTASVTVDKVDVLMVVRDGAGVELFGGTIWDQARRAYKVSAGETVTYRFEFDNVLASGPHGVSLTLLRRPDEKGDGVVTLDHRDTAAAFTSLKGAVPPPPEHSGIIRGKLRVPIQAVFRRHRANNAVQS